MDPPLTVVPPSYRWVPVLPLDPLSDAPFTVGSPSYRWTPLLPLALQFHRWIPFFTVGFPVLPLDRLFTVGSRFYRWIPLLPLGHLRTVGSSIYRCITLLPSNLPLTVGSSDALGDVAEAEGPELPPPRRHLEQHAEQVFDH